MQHLLRECIDQFGPAPREFSFWDRMTYLRVPKPSWLRQDPTDRLNILFKNLQTLFADGIVVWGHIVQANSLLFSNNSYNCPGEVVYSIPDRRHADPPRLEQVARKLFALKGTEPGDSNLAPIAEYLTDERIRVFGLRVPSHISPDLRCQISSTFFVRKHLPHRRLCAGFLPLIVNPVKPFVVMPLPEGYWPDALLEWWSA